MPPDTTCQFDWPSTFCFYAVGSPSYCTCIRTCFAVSELEADAENGPVSIESSRRDETGHLAYLINEGLSLSRCAVHIDGVWTLLQRKTLSADSTGCRSHRFPTTGHEQLSHEATFSATSAREPCSNSSQIVDYCELDKHTENETQTSF